jgi:hypothetical protein
MASGLRIGHRDRVLNVRRQRHVAAYVVPAKVGGQGSRAHGRWAAGSRCQPRRRLQF